MPRLTVKSVEQLMSEKGLMLNIGDGADKYFVTEEGQQVFAARTLSLLLVEYKNYEARCSDVGNEQPQVQAQEQSETCKLVVVGDLQQTTFGFEDVPAPVDYWTRWWRFYEYSKRQSIGAVTAAKHIVVSRTPNFELRQNEWGNLAIFTGHKYVLGNYEDEHEAQLALIDLGVVWQALLARPRHLKDLRHLVSMMFAFVALDSLEKCLLVSKDSAGIYSLICNFV